MKLIDLQNSMKDMPQTECPVTHHFSDGVYARELLIPAGVCVVGAQHKTNHFLILLTGIVHVSTNGEKAQRMQAPQILETKSGTKRAFTTETETRLITFHVTEETDVEKIGEKILADDFSGVPQWKKELLENKS